MADNPWPADAIERRPIASLRNYAKNARTHSDDQIAQIMASMEEWGFTNPLLVDEGDTLIAGHGRYEAARRLGLQTVPVMVARGWTERQIKAYRIADNKLALNAGWDVKLLAAELGELSDMTELIGFSNDELVLFLANAEDEPPLPNLEEARRTLAERFGVPPFSVLNAREGPWQERKRAWLALGIQSELGRGENLQGMSEANQAYMYDKKTYTGRKAANATVSGHALPASDYSKSKARGDGKGRAAGKTANGKGKARAFGQDLMRGEHKLKKEPN